MVCERCWSDSGGDAMRYAQLINERNEQGRRCTAAQECGERHLIVPGLNRCRCGKVTTTPTPDEGASDA